MSDSKVTSISKGTKPNSKANKGFKALPSRSLINPAIKADDEKGNEFVLQADIRAADVYALAYIAADGAIENAEREFCKAFSTNHEGHLKPAIKAGFAKLKESGAFNGLQKQTVDNLSSCAQWVAVQSYDVQDELFDSSAFRKAYHAARWPVKGSTSSDNDTSATDTNEVKEAPVSVPRYVGKPVQSFNEEANEIAMELNSVIEHISDVMKKYPQHEGSAVLEFLAREIGFSIEKAAKSRLQLARSETVKQAMAA